MGSKEEGSQASRRAAGLGHCKLAGSSPRGPQVSGGHMRPPSASPPLDDPSHTGRQSRGTLAHQAYCAVLRTEWTHGGSRRATYGHSRTALSPSICSAYVVGLGPNSLNLPPFHPTHPIRDYSAWPETGLRLSPAKIGTNGSSRTREDHKAERFEVAVAAEDLGNPCCSSGRCACSVGE